MTSDWPGLISTVGMPADRARSTGAAMYGKTLLVPTEKTRSNPADHLAIQEHQLLDR